jgi:hypothetical protein
VFLGLGGNEVADRGWHDRAEGLPDGGGTSRRKLRVGGLGTSMLDSFRLSRAPTSGASISVLVSFPSVFVIQPPCDWAKNHARTVSGVQQSMIPGTVHNNIGFLTMSEI